MQENEQKNTENQIDSITLTYTGPGSRLDKRLVTQLPYSRSFFEHIIKDGKLKIEDGTGKSFTPKKSYKVQEGDVITIENLDRFEDGGILEEAKWVDIPVLLERDDYLVIHKPKGVLSHPNSVRDLETPSVVARAYHRYTSPQPSPGRRGSQNIDGLPSSGNFIRAGLIHRLDRDTDGVMLIVKTEAGLAYFKNLFQQKSLCETIEEKEAVPLKKYYRAVCDITPCGQTFLDDISSQLPHTPHIIIQDVIPNVPHPVVKEGITKILNIEEGKDGKMHCDIEILTGRTHQIRYHLSRAGLPIVGDYLYHPTYMKKNKTKNKNTDSHPKLALTARKLEFTDIYGEDICVEIE